MHSNVDETSRAKRLEDLEIALRFLSISALAVPTWFGLSSAISVPKHTAIFRDMLGSLERLPPLTNFITNAANHGLPFFAIPIVFAIVGVLAALRLPTRRWLCIYLAAIAGSAGFWFVVERSLQQPVMKIFQGISGRY